MDVDQTSQVISRQDPAALEKELDEKYPNRPHNHSKTLPFHVLFQDLFDPLNDNKKRPSGPPINRRKQGPHGAHSNSPQEVRRAIIERFISRWRQEVGSDIYPAFRLIIPEKDRERAMYGLKEKALGKLLVQIMKIDKNSEDGFSLLNWKLPGQNAASRMAGDFAGRCYEVISKRPMRTEVGDMTIGEVNDLLDELSAAPREDYQRPILARFYQRMNATELMWLVRIILRQMKVGATERTFFDLWHPDAESLFNVSSSLRRVCWELHDPSIRLEGDERGITLMQCFQPQLAQFQMHSFQRMVEKMRLTEEDPTFWIEEKLDGERMQLHMTADHSLPGGKRFNFWSRKAKDYTYLYGDSFEDDNSALTRHLKSAFRDGVQNIILDGEMITWDPEQDAQVPFGTLKTAALSEQRNPFSTGHRPVYRVFDILYLNDQPLTRYTLRDRRKALEHSISTIPRRFEIHTYTEAQKAEEIEPLLRNVVAQASEGLVLKNPRSAYRLNERNDDWIKVKPEYMTEFGESLDCVVIGGYYGSGHRGGNLSSFLCGLRVDEGFARKGKWNPEKFHSFFKVGGGFTASDYAEIRHRTDGKWIDWKPKAPPTEYIELGGGDLQYERPDVWIKPSESVVLEVKAASIATSDQFRTGVTLRFPRFKRLRLDKDWQSALTMQEFLDLKSNVEKEKKDKEFRVDDERKKRKKTFQSRKKVLTVAGYNARTIANDEFANDAANGDSPELPTKVFTGLTFFIITEALHPPTIKKSKIELENLVKLHGGIIVQTQDAVPDTVCIADRRAVKVASIQKSKEKTIIRPVWLLDCIEQARKDRAMGLPELLVPLESERHIFSVAEDQDQDLEGNTDQFGDAFARDTSVMELKELLEKMGQGVERLEREAVVEAVREVEGEEQRKAGWLFMGTKLFFDPAAPNSDENTLSNATEEDSDQKLASLTARFAGATVTQNPDDNHITHVVLNRNSDTKAIRGRLAQHRKKIPRLVTRRWIEESWAEKTRLDEERFGAS
ncbi:DNA ligase 4 [Endocarpon pusillum Z07020]|uniref:DNA ligase n=1 Tax=Endocarpon pusillum (strain Z07020 / HMAS-L-300199) TaxID=1263415 RepID=U1G5T6_ENDPU|nr:DNA ligase 4 [Endocarpon pusillum Z07020]ERF72692.1 DNA ligase 4 [Endocarpon pusillum Z07020]